MDYFAKWRQGLLNPGGTSLWARVDAAADATYENIVKGQDVTNLDTALAEGAFGNLPLIKKWFDLNQSYFANPTTGSAPGLGFATDSWNSYFSARRHRAPYHFAELYYDNSGQRFAAQWVFPKGTWAANIGDNSASGLHKYGAFALSGSGAGAWASADGILPGQTIAGVESNVCMGAVILVSTAGSTATAASVTATLQDRTTTKTIALATGSSFTANTQFVLGEEVLTGQANSGQKIVEVAATGQFTVGDWVLVSDSDGVTEACKVASIQANTSITMEDNLVHTFTLAKSSKVWPLFVNAQIAGITGGGNGQNVQVYARPDRAIAL
jgi:hypothetical protein